MVNKHLVLRVRRIIGIHDESRQVTTAVNPERVAVEVSRRSLELDKRSSFALLAVEDHLTNRSKVIVIVNQSGEELVDHSAFHAVGIAFFCAFLETFDAPLNQVGLALPFELDDVAVEKLDEERSVLEDLLAIEVDRVHLQSDVLLLPVGGSRNAEELLASLCDERLCDCHVANIETRALELRLVLLDQVLTKSLGNIRVERLDNVSMIQICENKE